MLILSSHLRLGIPSCPFPLRFPTKTLYTPHLSPIRETFPVHLILLDFITRITLVKSTDQLSSSLSSFLHSSVVSSVLGPNILLVTLFSDTFSIRSSLNVSNHVSRPY